jgi:Tfp pilus assembly protein PilO
MSGFLDQLNLTPQERRIVVIIAVVVFVVLNLLLVWPHFKDLAQVRRQLDETRKTMRDWKEKILMDEDPSTNGYKVILHKLERQQGGGIVNQQVQLQRTVSDQAIKTGVNVDEIRPVNSAHPDTNEFYAEQSVKISFECEEAQLVNFLFNVGNDPAMIRVRELGLKTADANRYRLKGDAILTANYARQTPKPAPKPASPAGEKPAVAPKPAPGDKSIPVPKPALNPRNAPAVPAARKNL